MTSSVATAKRLPFDELPGEGAFFIALNSPTTAF